MGSLFSLQAPGLRLRLRVASWDFWVSLVFFCSHYIYRHNPFLCSSILCFFITNTNQNQENYIFFLFFVSWLFEDWAMAPSFDYVVSSLLCAEEDSSVFDDINGSVVDEFENDATWHHGNNRTQHRSRRFDDGGDMLLSLPLQSDECLALLLEKECHHLPHNDYLKRLRTGDLDLAARQEAVDWIAKVGSFKSIWY